MAKALVLGFAVVSREADSLSRLINMAAPE